jgi:hypothetical protein
MTRQHIDTFLRGVRMRNPQVDRREPSSHDIARLAYYYYETRGRQDGHDVDDWLSAEQTLRRHHR